MQGTKEDTAQHKKPKFLSKAGWVKKAHGKLLTSYKDRYIHVEKTEVVVYEHEVQRMKSTYYPSLCAIMNLSIIGEKISTLTVGRTDVHIIYLYFVLKDLQNCLERFDLEKYDSCHELKSPFKKKHRLVLIRSPKSGNKVS